MITRILRCAQAWLATLVGCIKRRPMKASGLTAGECAKDTCIPRLFEAQVRRTPDAIAVVFEEQYLTYAELNRQANQLAHYLRTLDVGPDVFVGICMERSLHMVVALLGILKAGGAYMPLDPTLPQDRYTFILEDAPVLALITQDHLVSRLPRCKTRLICLDADWEVISRQCDTDPIDESHTDHLAYVIYTSGSTGKPKGVLIPRRALVNHAFAVAKCYDLQASDRVLQFASLSFDVAAEEIIPSWLSGATVVLLPDRTPASFRDFRRFVEKERLTVLNLPTRYWQDWVTELWRTKVSLPSTLRLVIVGGEPVSTAHLLRWQELVGERIRWCNAYGPTEATITATIYEPQKGQHHDTASVPIGRPIANAQVYILDRSLEPVPIGVGGELHIGGEGLARGYLNRPELTTQRFLPDPFSDKPHALLYKTGDLARYLPDGNIEFLGRLDYQVKIRGFRIELGEIEMVLGQHQDVREAIVLAQEDVLGEKRLVAYVVPDQSLAPSARELRCFLQAKLPDYMIPAAFVWLAALPLTSGGKVNRQALPSPNWRRPEAHNTFVAPRTPTEETMAGVWGEVLGIDQVGVFDTFFELGGDSLLAMRMISRLCDTFQVELSLQDVFKTSTLANLAQDIEAARQAGQHQQTRLIQPGPRDGAMSLSFAQQRLWFLDQMQSGNPVYNITTALRLTGCLNLDALERSFNEIVRRHEALRTTFASPNGEPVQIVSPVMTVPLQVLDLQKLSEVEPEEEMLRLMTEEARKSFDLGRGPLFQTSVLRLGQEEHVLLLVMHHIIADGWSIRVLIQELSALYEAFSLGNSPSLPDLPIQYVDFARWQRQQLQGAVLEGQLAYWQGQLAGEIPVVTLPTDRPRPAVQTFRGACHSLVLSETLCKALKELGQQEGSTLFMTLLAAFKTLLHRYTGQDDIIVGSPIAGRNRRETDKLIGFFVNTLVLRTSLSGNPSFRELLGRVREVALNAYAHQELPFEHLVEALQPQRDLSRNPLFQIMFVLQNVPLPAPQLPGLSLYPLQVDNGTAQFDLTLMMEETTQGLRGTVEYNTDLFDRATITRMLTHYQILLEGLVENPARRLSDLPLLSAAERHQLLVTQNSTTADYPKAQCIHELIEAQVHQTPDALAVVFEEQRLTYSELNARTNQLAHYLRRSGVGPDVLVALCMSRSLEMIIGLLAILKAGGAYVPLDPAYPAERLAFMLEDTQATVLITQQQLLERLPAHEARVVCLDTDWPVITQESDKNPNHEARADNLAYVIYTSGSTGCPKGVLVEHRGLCNLAKAQLQVFNVRPDDRVLQFASLSFDASIFEIILALGLGATLYLGSPSSLLPGLELMHFIRHHAITVATLPPAVLSALPVEQLPALRIMNVAGEPCPADVVARWAAGRQFFNLYGPTEATVWATFTVCSGPTRKPSIGRPIANTHVYILDTQQQPVPIGVPGELYIGGVGVTRGYLNRPELTDEKFIPHPFSDEPGARLYRTGDVARYLPDGNIDFLGRLDNQVKIRGFRIEAEEVERTLSQHPAIQETIVLAREDIPGDKRLVAYLVLKSTLLLSISDVRLFLQKRLPAYMIPAAFVMLDRLPLLPNGKVNRRALPAPDGMRPDLNATFVTPRTSVEEALARIWCQVLGIERVGIHDNFFELGGDSILSIQIVARAREAGLNLTPRQLFQHQTIAELSAVVHTIYANHAEQGPVTGLLPLTPIQRWFFGRRLPDPHHWNQAMMLKIRHPIPPAQLERTVRELLWHHDVLRLRFRCETADWRQRCAEPDQTVPFSRVDLSMVPEAEQGRAMQTIATEMQASLNLSDGPLVRVGLFDLGPHRPSRLLLIIHHLAVDSVSWRILLEDFQRAIEQLTRGEAIQLPPKTTSFKYWAQRLAEYAQTGQLRQELTYWLAAPREHASCLPVDYPAGKGANTEASARTVSVSLSVEETRGLLQEVPRAYYTEINDVLLTALVQTLTQWTGTSSVLVDLEGHGRESIIDNVDLSRTVGWFTTLFPVCLSRQDTSDLGRTLRSIKQQLRDVPNRGIGYGILRYLCEDREVTEALQSLPQAEVSFNYLGQFDQMMPAESALRFAPESVGPCHSPRGLRCHLLEVNGLVTNSRLQLDWTYSETVHRHSTVERLAQSFIAVLRALVLHWQSPIEGNFTHSDFPMAGLDAQQFRELSALIDRVDRKPRFST